MQRCSYVAGDYGSDEGFTNLDKELKALEAKRGGKEPLQIIMFWSMRSCNSRSNAESTGPEANRVFYFAIPPSVFADTARSIKHAALSTTGWNRMIVEKPFGK